MATAAGRGRGAAGASGESRPEHCGVCGLELVSICIVVDGNELIMQSCQKCDTRRWNLAGRPIALEEALAEVGEHAGRRR